jgi:mRNA interferase RelE/StbE
MKGTAPFFGRDAVEYRVEIKKQALKELDSLPHGDAIRLIRGMRLLADNLRGDVKRLSHHTPEFRLRVGDWRVLFEIEGGAIVVHHIKHRREAYR